MSWTNTIFSVAGKCTSDKSLRTSTAAWWVGHFHAAPAHWRLKDHQEIGHAVAPVFIVVPSGGSIWFLWFGAGVASSATARLLVEAAAGHRA